MQNIYADSKITPWLSGWHRKKHTQILKNRIFSSVFVNIIFVRLVSETLRLVNETHGFFMRCRLYTRSNAFLYIFFFPKRS